VEAAGADALCAINTFVGMSIDLNTHSPRLSFRTGGLSGPAIRPLAVHLAHQAARAVTIPVIGIGGITRAEDALEFLVAGCAAVQVGTATFRDPRAPWKVLRQVARWCADHQTTVADVRAEVRARTAPPQDASPQMSSAASDADARVDVTAATTDARVTPLENGDSHG